MLTLVRQLQPSEWGLPVQLYFFSANVNWVPYEQLQSEVLSHVIALAPALRSADLPGPDRGRPAAAGA